jgi:predicted AAA+ superfamily ATPase
VLFNHSPVDTERKEQKIIIVDPGIRSCVFFMHCSSSVQNLVLASLVFHYRGTEKSATESERSPTKIDLLKPVYLAMKAAERNGRCK